MVRSAAPAMESPRAAGTKGHTRRPFTTDTSCLTAPGAGIWAWLTQSHTVGPHHVAIRLPARLWSHLKGGWEVRRAQLPVHHVIVSGPQTTTCAPSQEAS